MNNRSTVKTIIKKRNKISNQLADNVIGYVLRDVFGDDVEYDLSGEFKPDKEAAPLYFQVPKGRVWETKGRYNIKAAYNGVNIELGNYYINEMEENIIIYMKMYMKKEWIYQSLMAI